MPRIVRRRRPARKARKVKGRKGARRVGKSRIPAAIAGPGQYATCVETLEYPDAFSNAGLACTFTIGQFPRSQLMSTMFSFYKAARVVWTYEPLFNTFQDGLTYSKPYLYTVMNRQQEPLAAARNNFLAAGARPEALVSKKVVTYVPNWCSPGLGAYAGNLSLGQVNALYNTGLQKQYGWLATNPIALTTQDNANDIIMNPLNDTTGGTGLNTIITNNVSYNGHYLFIDQAVNGTPSVPVMRVTCQVTWMFKGAKSNYRAPSAVDAPLKEVPV